MSSDPLTDMVAMLQPSAPFSKRVSGAGHWRVRRTRYSRPFFCVILDGACWLQVDGQPMTRLQREDFVLIPTSQDFTLYGQDDCQLEGAHTVLPDGEMRHGRADGPPDVRLLVGYCEFGSPDAHLLVALLPQMVHIQAQPRLATLVQLVRDESLAARPGREAILARLLEVLLLEALRCAPTGASPGLLSALADERLAAAMRCMHEHPAKSWTVAQLAREAALSRSAFFARFQRIVGTAPMEYLLAWRMAMARHLLLRRDANLAEVAQRVGYGSASAFSVAFTRHVGMPPGQYGREAMD